MEGQLDLDMCNANVLHWLFLQKVSVLHCTMLYVKAVDNVHVHEPNID